MLNSVKIRHKVTSKTAPKDKKKLLSKLQETFKNFLNLSKSCELVAFKNCHFLGSDWTPIEVQLKPLEHSPSLMLYLSSIFLNCTKNNVTSHRGSWKVE